MTWISNKKYCRTNFTGNLNNNVYPFTGKPDLIKIEFLKIHSS